MAPTAPDKATLPLAVVINLPQHTCRLEKIRQRLAAEGVPFELADAVDGSLLSRKSLKAEVTPLGRHLLTPGMIGCFLSHRRCWQQCLRSAKPLLILEDDAILEQGGCGGFRASLCASLDELQAIDPEWEVLLLGAMGMIHPEGWRMYGVNMIVGLVAGTVRSPRRLSQSIHVPGRPMCTHAYVLSPMGAARLLEAFPRANFHVDVSAWGVRALRLYLAVPLLAKQDTAVKTTIGGGHDTKWVPSFTIDRYSGAEFVWVFNGPVFQIGGVLLTLGRSVVSSALFCVIAIITRSSALGALAAGWILFQLGLINALKMTR